MCNDCAMYIMRFPSCPYYIVQLHTLLAYMHCWYKLQIYKIFHNFESFRAKMLFLARGGWQIYGTDTEFHPKAMQNPYPEYFSYVFVTSYIIVCDFEAIAIPPSTIERT